MDFASLYSPAFCVEDGETRFFEFSEASTGFLLFFFFLSLSLSLSFFFFSKISFFVLVQDKNKSHLFSLFQRVVKPFLSSLVVSSRQERSVPIIYCVCKVPLLVLEVLRLR